MVVAEESINVDMNCVNEILRKIYFEIYIMKLDIPFSFPIESFVLSSVGSKDAASIGLLVSISSRMVVAEESVNIEMICVSIKPWAKSRFLKTFRMTNWFM